MKAKRTYLRSHQPMPPNVTTFDQWLAWSLRQCELMHEIRMMRQKEYESFGFIPARTGLRAFLRDLWARAKEFVTSLRAGFKHPENPIGDKR